jgi:hypothetical protein
VKISIGILAAMALSCCAYAPAAPTLVGPDTYLLWSGRAGKAEDNLGQLGMAIAKARDFCASMDKTPEIRTESSDGRERATFTCEAPSR